MRVISEHNVITRKPHHCFGCTREYPVGTKMNYIVNVDDVISGSYWCEICENYMDKQIPHLYDDGIFYGDLLNEEDYPDRLNIKWNQKAEAK
jgi:hypothetical protein